MDYLLFFGSGGGRFNAVTQFNPTGGFQLVIGDQYRIHVDPGPSTAAYLKELDINPELIDAILTTHHHFDHAHDVIVLIEGMRKRNRNTTEGVLVSTPYGLGRIPEYHQHFLSKIYPLLPGDHCTLPGPPSVEVQATLADHPSAGQAMGFIIAANGWRLGITGDTIIYPDFAETYAGVDVLVAYLHSPQSHASKSHMCTSDLITAIRKIQETGHIHAVILTHFGRQVANPAIEDRSGKEAMKIEEATGIQTLAAYLGFRFNL